MSNQYKTALCQMMTSGDKEENKRRAEGLVKEAALSGAGVVCLPEIWNSPYDMKLFAENAEPEDGSTCMLMSGLARKYQIILIGGSIPERDGDLIYNTSFVYDQSGEVAAKYRKMHLFDVDIKGGLRFKESDAFSAGEKLAVFDTDFGRMGVAICFDLRFPEMFKEMTDAGADIIFLPAAFNISTGAIHLDTLAKCRALDNQVYLAVCAPARNLTASFIPWSHSAVATPWGEYCAAADSRETVLFADIDMDYLFRIRQEMPVGRQER